MLRMHMKIEVDKEKQKLVDLELIQHQYTQRL